MGSCMLTYYCVNNAALTLSSELVGYMPIFQLASRAVPSVMLATAREPSLRGISVYAASVVALRVCAQQLTARVC